MAVYGRSRRQRFVLVLLVLSSVTLITLDYRDQGRGVIEALRGSARDALLPLQSATERVVSPVSDFFGGLTHYGELKAENERLRRELEEARVDRIRARDAEQARRNIAAIQNLRFAAGIPTVAARVIATAPSNFQLTVEIDRGADARIARGMPVVTGGGLVGRVQDVSSRRSTVLLMTDRTFDVGVRIRSSDAVGVASGDGRELLKVDLIDPGMKIEVGEAAVTSGLQHSRFPPDVPVGKVVKAENRPGSLQQDVMVEPAVNLRRLEFVKVLRWSGS